MDNRNIFKHYTIPHFGDSMPECKKCNKHFNNYEVIDGKKRNLSKRVFCIECSPFGKHNTSDISIIFDNKKLCKKCGVVKNIKDFYQMKGKPNGHPDCKMCFNKYNGERLKQRKKELIDMFGGKCHECKNKYHYSVFEFHHLDPTIKDKKIGRLVGKTIEKLKDELKSCIMVCANCHRLLHYDEDYTPVSSNLD